jgi:DNA mismatch repair protein MSH4
MAMLYKVAEGAVKNSHYGLALARVVPLPPGLVEHATWVAEKLERQVQQRKKTSVAVIKERRRKLILNLKEHLVQAQNGTMKGEVLAAWLKELQKEFVMRMTAIDDDAMETERNSENEDEDEPMQEESEYDRDNTENDRPMSHSTHTSEPSVISISSRISSSESDTTIRAVSENEY